LLIVGCILSRAASYEARNTVPVVMRCVDYTSCSLYRFDPPDDEQQAYSKHVEAYY